MIFYDSHKWRTLARIHGSVFPRAIISALPSALVALGLKYLEKEGFINLDGLQMLDKGSIYSGFTFVLGFSLVFRTSESYARYWMAATSVHEMGSEWSDACASIIAFSKVSKRPREEVQRFAHTVIRLFSLLHATALEEISSMERADFSLIDVAGFNKKDLSFLATDVTQGRRMNVILCWIKVYIIRSLESGLLSVPAPILTRVFQEFGSGLINYHKAQQVVIWPFPFPYTQLNLTLLYIYMIMTPLVVCLWDAEPWLCCLFTFISVICMIGLDLIASELENPFGDDPNDLPGLEMQEAYNRGLLLLVQPETWNPPRLLPTALTDPEALTSARSAAQMSFAEFEKTVSLKAFRHTGRTDKVGSQLSWARQQWPTSGKRKVHRWLQLSQADVEEALVPPQEEDESDKVSGRVESPDYSLDASHVLCGGPLHTQSSTSVLSKVSGPETSRSVNQGRAATPVRAGGQDETGAAANGDRPFGDFLRALTAEMQQQLQRQLRHQDTLMSRQLAMHEQVLAEWSGHMLRSRSGAETDPAPWAASPACAGTGAGSADLTKRSVPISSFRMEAMRRTSAGRLQEVPMVHQVSGL